MKDSCDAVVAPIDLTTVATATRCDNYKDHCQTKIFNAMYPNKEFDSSAKKFEGMTSFCAANVVCGINAYFI